MKAVTIALPALVLIGSFGSCWGAASSSDAHLNTSWKRVTSCYDKLGKRDPATADAVKESREALLAEQRLWIKWKDAACRYYDRQEIFGSMGVRNSDPGCIEAIVDQRTKTLQDLADDLCSRAN